MSNIDEFGMACGNKVNRTFFQFSLMLNQSPFGFSGLLASRVHTEVSSLWNTTVQ